MSQPIKKKSLILAIGARLPESNVLFFILSLMTILASLLLQGNYQAINDQQNYQVVNLLSVNEIRWIFNNVIHNLISYPALGVGIISIIGFGFAEKVGLLSAMIKTIGARVSDKFILAIIIFAGINSSLASSAGYVVLVPLAGILYAGIGKNPIVGIVAAFAAVSAGFGANLLPTPGDAILGTITESIIQQTEGSLKLHPITMNLFFMFASTFFLVILLSWITQSWIAPRLTSYSVTLPDEEILNSFQLSSSEKKGLIAAIITFVIVSSLFVVLYFYGVLAPYQNEMGKTINPLLNNVIILMVLLFLLPALSFGIVIGKIRSTHDYMNLTVEAIKDIAYIIAFSIFAGNFLGLFNHSGLSQLIANSGAHLLLALQLNNQYLLLLLFILLTAFINLFIGSASAKWVIFAPIFLPMLITVSNGQLPPEAIQAAYRIADSATNIITPLMPFLPFTLVFIKKYNKQFELGDFIAIMMPYSIFILVGWTLFFLAWYGLNIPFGI